ncbi:MAG TPA: fibronectin type III domain-containing protein, partial [Chryseosolibacter sp.]
MKSELGSIVQAINPPANLIVNSRTTGSVGLQWTASAGAVGYRIYRDATLVDSTTATTIVINGLSPNTTYIFKVTAYDNAGESIASNAVSGATLLACASSGSGTIPLETWSDIVTTKMTDVPFNTAPTRVNTITLFEGPTNAADNYASRIRGYVCAPLSGNYTFWIAGDDQCQLFISTNADPSNKIRIITLDAWTRSREWTKYATQKSAPVRLEAGHQYYIEAIMREGTGGDNFAVGWQLPDGRLERPIPGTRLTPFVPTYPSAPAAITVTSKTSTEVSLRWKAATDDGGVTGYEIF